MDDVGGGIIAELAIDADFLELMVGQGAKPGEGGHLPGFKVTAKIAAGYQPLMPTFQGQVSEDDLIRLLAYVRPLGAEQPAPVAVESPASALESRGAEAVASGRVHGPVGLDIGGEGPELIGLAIVAQIAAVMHGRDGRDLRERTAPIHDVADGATGPMSLVSSPSAERPPAVGSPG